jgi:hypothetical protein
VSYTIEERVDATIARIRREDSDFITPDTIQAYTGCTIEEARQGIVRAFGQDWLDRQDQSLAQRAADKRTAQLWYQDAKP